MAFARTADFQDSNNNGTDDRDEKSNRQQTPQYTQDTNKLYQGNMNFGSIMGGIYGNQPGEDDDEGRAMKNAFAYDTASKYFDSNLAMGLSDFQSGLSQENMAFASNLSQQEQSNSRYEEFNYGMHALDKQYEVSNQFANQNYGRDIGYLGASGEQTRKNMQAEGQQNRLQSITDGEQQRQGYRVVGDQTRKTDTNRITTEGSEERNTLTHEDKLTAGKAKRHNARARATARSF